VSGARGRVILSSPPSRCTFRSPDLLRGYICGLAQDYQCSTIRLVLGTAKRWFSLSSPDYSIRSFPLPKVLKTCVRCGVEFSIFPSRERWQAARGVEIKFCSRKCTAEARAAGEIGSRKREGGELPCSTCGAPVYLKQYKLKRDTLHFCSQGCRIKAISENRIDRKFDQVAEKKRTGQSFSCCVCGKEKYQKASYIARGVNKTCGSRSCLSAYLRSLWSLPPCSDDERRKSGRRGPRPKRASNFTDKQRQNWLEDACARCGTSDNLALDHILAVSCGGKSERENAQTLCQPCNNWKMKHIDKPLARAWNKLQKAA